MATWCYNTISFTGRYKNFAKQLEKHNYNGRGFPFIEGGRCIFSLEKTTDGVYSFESYRTPLIEEFVESAKKDGFSFEIDYKQPDDCIYGKAKFDKINGLVRYDLSKETFNRLAYINERAFVDYLPIESGMEWLGEQLEILIKNK